LCSLLGRSKGSHIALSLNLRKQLCGRSKSNFDHIGNRRLRILVANKLKAYVDAPTRRDKSDIISEVAAQARQRCHGGGFVRKDKDGHWTDVGPTWAREKTSHVFRDSLLKQKRMQGDGDGDGDGIEANRARTWMEAQDHIFSLLHLHSESVRTDRGPEHHDRRTSATSTSTGTTTGMGTSTSINIQKPSETMQPPRPVPELYTNQYSIYPAWDTNF
jgi:hypothetical protein